MTVTELVRRCSDIYREDGLNTLTRKAVRFGVGEVVANITRYPVIDSVMFRQSKRRLSRLMEGENCLDDVLDTAFGFQGFGRYSSIEPSQIRSEFRRLLELVAEQNPETVMEIGTSSGGSFYAWCRHLESANTIISLDLPGGEFGSGYPAKKIQLFKEFTPVKELHFLRKNSHDKGTLADVEDITKDDDIDFLFIDGDHTYEGVKQDFEMYSPLVADGGLIALHDIVYHPNYPRCEVDEFWSEIKTEHETVEIISSPEQTWAGIGVVFL